MNKQITTIEDNAEYLVGAVGCDYDDAIYALQACGNDTGKAIARLEADLAKGR